MASIQNNIKQKQTEDFIRIQDILYLCISKWKWFIASLFITLGIAFTYLLITPAVYIRSAAILIKEDTKGHSLSSDVSSLFADFGFSQANTNVNNELTAIQSPAIILETVKRLHLDVDYKVKGTFHKETLYGPNQTIKVSFLDLADNESGGLTVKILTDGLVELSDFTCIPSRDIAEQTLKGQMNDTIATPIGKIIITPTLYYYTREVASPIYVSRTNLYDITDECISNLTASLSEEKTTIINLSYKDVSIQRAEDVLNTLIAIYNENWVKDKNMITVSTSMFINERLRVIEQELGDVDENISSYKSENLLPNVEAASSMYMAQAQETNNLILDLNTRLSMARYIRNYLTNNTNKTQLLPANSGIESSSIEGQISEYNTILLQRNNLVANSSDKNPLVVDLDQSLDAMRKAIISSIDNLVVTLNTQITNLQHNEQQTTAQIAANPNQAKYLLSVGRQQKVKEALYLFLLQKREENELSQAFTAYNTRLLTPPTGNMRPIAPIKKNIILIALVAGILTPALICFIILNTNTTIRGRKDLEEVAMPFIGEIPLTYSQKRNGIFGKKQPKNETIVVKEGERNVINEAFRVLRTNLEFMIGKNSKSNIIVLTSFNPGSGKTFLTINIGISLAIKGKKVLVIDGDMRHASLSILVESPHKGLSNYLAGQIDSPHDIIISDNRYANLHILPSGSIPPNPTELLFSERLEKILNELREKYDYIFIDCPPIEIVADTSIIEKHADRTIFVVRSGLLERSMLTELETIYEKQKFKNMSIVLNGTTNDTLYGYNRYGYGYGYGYGYPHK